MTARAFDRATRPLASTSSARNRSNAAWLRDQLLKLADQLALEECERLARKAGAR